MTEINFQTAQFLISAPSIKECPSEEGSEVAFAGRSNAGKSSAINALTQSKKLARTSKTPGRTQLINFFSLENDDKKRIVDLPGYGYAKVPLTMKKKWQAHMSAYLYERQCLKGLILLMDIRHPLQEIDSMMINWAVDADMPVHALLTKSDKLSNGAAQRALLNTGATLEREGIPCTLQTFSALKKTGIDDAHELLDMYLKSDDVESDAVVTEE